jgi:hypothetical protein
VVKLEEGVYKNANTLVKFMASCRCYVGTFTMPNAVAEALHTPRIVELPTIARYHDAWPINPGGFLNEGLTPQELRERIKEL